MIGESVYSAGPLDRNVMPLLWHGDCLDLHDPLDLGPFRHHMGRPDARLRVRAFDDGRAVRLNNSGLGDLDNGFRKRPEQHDNRRRSDDVKCRHHGPVELVAQWRHQAHTTETNVRSAVGMAGAAASGIVTV